MEGSLNVVEASLGALLVVIGNVKVALDHLALAGHHIDFGFLLIDAHGLDLELGGEGVGLRHAHKNLAGLTEAHERHAIILIGVHKYHELVF
jgi:hypothetical protein